MADFQFGLNTSTIRPASLPDKIRIADQAGYDAIELWIGDVEDYVAKGGKVADLVKMLDDAELDRPSMISLRNWCVADDGQFEAALEVARRQLKVAHDLGVKRMVAGPPGGVVPIPMAIDRYRRLLEVSVEQGVPASVEFLGFVQGINTLEIAWKICAGAADAAGTVTPDAWHMFRGGSDLDSLDKIPADHISIFHWNDAPAQPERVQQNDSHRVYPGDGIIPLKRIADKLRAKGWSGCLSLELFNPSYWNEDLLQVAKTGLAKMKQSVADRT